MQCATVRTLLLYLISLKLERNDRLYSQFIKKKTICQLIYTYFVLFFVKVQSVQARIQRLIRALSKLRLMACDRLKATVARSLDASQLLLPVRWCSQRARARIAANQLRFYEYSMYCLRMEFQLLRQSFASLQILVYCVLFAIEGH